MKPIQSGIALLCLGAMCSVTFASESDAPQIKRSAAVQRLQLDDGSLDRVIGSTGVDAFAQGFTFMTDVALETVEYCWFSANGATSNFQAIFSVYADNNGLPGTTIVAPTSTPPLSLASNIFSCIPLDISALGVTAKAGETLWIGAGWSNSNVGLGYEITRSSKTPTAIQLGGTWRATAGPFNPDVQAFGIRLTVETPSKGAAQLYVPYLVDDPTTGGVSLFAVRNVTETDVQIQIKYLMADGSDVTRPVETLKARATKTVNISNVGLPKASDGRAIGVANIRVIVPQGMSAPGALSGDFFLVDPVNNFATGDPLPSTANCTTFGTRFAEGGVFDGTTFTFGVAGFDAATAPDFNAVTGMAPFVNAEIYDETGALMEEVDVTASTGIFSMSTAELGALTAGGLPTFGTVEWSLLDGQVGHITWAMNAGGRFSVGMLGACLD